MKVIILMILFKFCVANVHSIAVSNERGVSYMYISLSTGWWTQEHVYKC